MNSNDGQEQRNDSASWQEKVLSFQNASVYIQLLNWRMKKAKEFEADQESSEEKVPRPDA